MRTNHYNYLIYFSWILLTIFSFSACQRDILFKDGKRIYISKIDSIKLYPGQNRLKMTLFISNPDIVNAKIFWNKRINSIDVPVNRITGSKNFSIIIDQLEEGEYPFEIIAYDIKGNTTAPISIVSKIYGLQYIQSLLSESIKDIRYENGETSVFWGDAGQGAKFTEVSYTDQTDAIRTINIPTTEVLSKLANFKPGTLETTFKYRTLYKPDPLAIDSFYSDYQTAKVITGTLKALAEAKNVYFGSFISYGGGFTHGVINDGSPNQIYSDICSREFNIGQATWGATGRWKREGNSNFDAVNPVINWSRSKYDKVMAMLLVGPNNYMPAWFNDGVFTPDEMDVMLKGLVYEIMESNGNKSKVDVWCVANELFNNDGTYRTMTWNDMGWEDDASGLTGTDQVNLKHPVFIGKAFQYSREKTNALLELRDYGIENSDQNNFYSYKYKAFYELIKHLKATRRPVDVVGIQAHIIIGRGMTVGTSVNMNADGKDVSYTGFKNAISKYKETGVDVYLTELDIVSPIVNSQPQPWTNALAEQQRIDYYNVVKAAIECGVNLISLWGVRDNNDPGWRVGQNPLLFNENYSKKPAYFGVQKALYDIQK